MLKSVYEPLLMKLFYSINSVTEEEVKVSAQEHVIYFLMFSTFFLWDLEDEHAVKTTVSPPLGYTDIYVIKCLFVY